MDSISSSVKVMESLHLIEEGDSCPKHATMASSSSLQIQAGDILSSPATASSDDACQEQSSQDQGDAIVIAGGREGMPCDGVMGSNRERRSPVSAGGGSGGGGSGSGNGDYLSALPDDMLLLILLRLPVADAARTSALSRRWRALFTDIHGVFLALPAARARLRFWGRPRPRRRRPRVIHSPPPPPHRHRPQRGGHLALYR